MKAGRAPGARMQRGGFVLGMVVGLLIGLALALGVALYITKAPVPFVNKVPQRTAEQDTAEQERNKNWDPNAPLAGKAGAKPVTPPPGAGSAPPAAAATVATPQAVTPPSPAQAALPPGVTLPPPSTSASAAVKPARDPAAILAGESTGSKADPFVYFVQVGAYSRSEDAEQQRAKLAMNGFNGRVTEREQSGRTVYRLRVGPYDTREEADGVQARLQEQSIEARLVRVER